MVQVSASLSEILAALLEGVTLTADQWQQLASRALEDERRAEAFGITPENVENAVKKRSRLFQSLFPDIIQLFPNSRLAQTESAYRSEVRSTEFETSLHTSVFTLHTSPQHLPLTLLETLWNFWLPLGCQIASERQVLGRPLIQGILGGQGTGKTTLAAVLTVILNHLGYRALSLSLDDLYLTYAERLALRAQDPRLVWRGPPGTHDIDLGIEVLERLRANEPKSPIQVPRFDKSALGGIGDRTEPIIVENVDIVLFEGWFVGVRPIDPDAFDAAPPPIVTEADRSFARDMNARLANYLPLWERLDKLMLLYPVDYHIAVQWRQQAERQMIAAGKSGMTDSMVEQFVEYFWRALHPELFIEPLTQNPSVADMAIEINSDRSVSAIYLCHNRPVEGWGTAMIGRLLDGRYRIVEVLGSGAFGRTYLAADTRRPGHPQCVVKQLQPPTDNPQLLKTALRLFKGEAETLEKLGRHEQIPQLLAYFEDSKQFYLVEEFVPGRPLATEIVAGKPLSEAKVIPILQEVLEILVFVHGQGVIHRDVNPSNIIRRQTDGKLVLIDFGSVKEVSTQIVSSNGQIPRTIATGTPAYMPIEQFQGNPQFNSDIYAVGMVAIQAVTGLQASDLPKLQNSKLQDPQANVGKVVWRHRARVSPELADVVDKMVCSYYGQRYQSAAEVLADLKKLTPTGEKTLQLPYRKGTIVSPEPENRLPVLTSKSRSLALAGVAALLLVGGALVIYGRLPQKLEAQHYVGQGVDKVKRENYKGAIADYNQAIKLSPTNSAAYYHRGLAYYNQGYRQQALDDFTKVIQLNPKDGMAYLHRGKTRFDLGDDKGALQDFDSSIALERKNASTYLNRGNVRASLGDERGAIEDYDRAIAINPSLAPAYLNRCLSRSNANDQPGAIEDCTQAIQLKPNYAFAYQNRGLARRRKGDIQGAIEDYNVGIKIAPQDADPYYNRGLARFDLGEKQGALEDFSSAIRLNTTHALAYYDRALVRAELGDKQGAIEDFQQSAKLCLDQGKISCYKDAQYQVSRLK